jgi:hypothetical protein
LPASGSRIRGAAKVAAAAMFRRNQLAYKGLQSGIRRPHAADRYFRKRTNRKL